MNEREIERAIDAAVWRRLSTDLDYQNAPDAETQAQREQEISDEEYERIMRENGRSTT